MYEDQTPKDGAPRGKKLSLTALGFIIWLASAALGLWDIYLGRQTAVRLIGRFSTDLPMATLAGNIIILVLAVTWLWYVIYGGEVNLKRMGHRTGWTFFAWGVAVELLILILYFLV
jgi:hypothetical protein